MRGLIRTAAWTGCTLLLAYAGAAPPCNAQDKDMAQIHRLLQQHDDAMKRKDLPALLALWAPAGKTVMMGTGPGELYQGRAAIKTAYQKFFNDYDQGSLRHNTLLRDAGRNGNMAWLISMSKFQDAHGDKRREFDLNTSAVMEKVNGRWFIRTLHYSNLTGPGASPYSQQ